MSKWTVTLNLELEEGNPNKWNWHELLDLSGNETVWVDITEGEN